MPIFQRCRGCGAPEGFSGLISGLCPECSRKRAAALADLQRNYQEAVRVGDPAASPFMSDLIQDYRQSEEDKAARFWGLTKQPHRGHSKTF